MSRLQTSPGGLVGCLQSADSWVRFPPASLARRCECGWECEQESTKSQIVFTLPPPNAHFNAARLLAISFNSAFCGSANFARPSFMSVSSSFAMSTFSAISFSTSGFGN